MILVPALDVREGRVVRLLQGDYARERSYDLDPAEVAAGHVRGGARRVHVVDLDAAREGAPRNAELVARVVAAVTAAGGEVQVGGGLRSLAAVEAVLAAGAHRAVVGTLAAEQPELLAELARRFGPRVVLGLDAREGLVAVRGWEASTGIPARELALRAAAAGLLEAVYTNVARDGTLAGPDVEGGARLQRESGLRITLSGGVGELAHLRAAARAGLHACIVGRALLEGRFDLAQALLACEEGPCSPGA